MGGGKYKVIESWRSEDGSSWYRKWSDGLIEQGVTYTQTATNDFHSEINFPIAFSNESFEVLAQKFKLDKDYKARAASTDIFGKTTSSVFCGWYWGDVTRITSIYVYARGY